MCLAVAATASARDDTAAFLDRMREHSGPVWRLHLHSTSHLSVNGAMISIATDTEGVRFYAHQCDGKLCVGTYYDGVRSYSVNINSTALPAARTDETLRSARIVASLAFLAPDFTDRGGLIDDQGLVTVDGTPLRDLLISAPLAPSVDVYVDPKTYLVRYARDVNGVATFAYSDYRRLDGGVSLPFSVTRNGVALEHYDARSVAGTAFAPPLGIRPAFRPAIERLALDREHATPIFDCTLGGIALKCLLDSGNSGLSVSLEVAERLNAHAVGQFTVHGLGDYATQVVEAGPLVAGSMTVADARYVVLHDIHRFGYDVVLGADVLASTSVQLDGAHHTIAFGAAPRRGGSVVPLSFQNFVPVLNVGLNDQTAVLALDTGDESTINLSYAYYREHPALFRATEQRAVSGVGGNGVELIGQIGSVRVGSYALREQQIGTTTTMQSTGSGHLGAGFLSQFLVTIDYQEGSLRLAPVSASPAPVNH